MKIAIAMLFSNAVVAVATAQQKETAANVVNPSVGLEMGQRTPVFALTDQFGHEQSNETLKVPKGQSSFFPFRRLVTLFAKRSSCSCKTPKQSSNNKILSWRH